MVVEKELIFSFVILYKYSVLSLSFSKSLHWQIDFNNKFNYEANSYLVSKSEISS